MFIREIFEPINYCCCTAPLINFRFARYICNNVIQKKAPKNAKRDIDRKTKSFAKTLKIEDRMECYSDQHAYITLKDHKENFINNTKSRLINPSKSEVGRVSKNCLNDIIADVSRKTEVNQWRGTATVINWFKNLCSQNVKTNIGKTFPKLVKKHFPRDH